MPATISHVLSATTPDDNNYEIRPSHWNSNHNVTVNAVGSEVSNAFGNGGGITFGLSADGKLTAQAPAGAPSPINFSAGTTSSNIGSVVFSNAGGVSFGLDASTMTATVKTAYLGLNTAGTNITWTANSSGISIDAGGYLTTARRSTDAIGLNTAQSNVTWTANSSGISLDARGYAGTGTSATNASVTMNSNGLAISVASPAAGIALYDGANSISTGTARFTNANGVSFSFNGQTISGSIATTYAGTGFTSTTTAGTQVKATLNTSGLSMAMPAVLTTAMLSNGGSNFVQAAAGFNGTNVSGTIASNSISMSVDISSLTVSGFLSLSSNGSTITIGAGPLTFYAASNTTNATSGTIDGSSIIFKGAGGVSVGVSNGSVVVSGGAAAGLNAVYDGANSISSGTIRYTNANGVSFTINGQTLSGSVVTSYRASNDAVGLNTAQSNVTWTVNSSGLSLDARGYAGTGTSATNASITLNSVGLAISVASPVAGIALYDGANSISTGTARFTNANGVSFTFNGQTISGSVVTSYRASNDAIGLNTAKTNVTWTANSSGLSFDAGGYAGTGTGFTGTGVSGTFTHNTVGLSLNLAISAIKGFGVSNTGATAGNTGISTGVDWVLAGSNLLTLSQSTAAGSNTVWIQHPAWLTTARGSTDAIGLATAKTNVTWTANSAGLSFDAAGYAGTGTSMSNATATLNSNGLQLSVPATSSLVGINGISISTGGSTISVMPQWGSFYENMEGMQGSTAMTWGGTSLSHAAAFMLPFPVSGSFIRIPALMTTNSTTLATLASATASGQGALFSTVNCAIYSLGVGANSQSLQYVASGSAGFTFSQKLSVTNSTQGSYTLGFSAQANGAGTSLSTQYSISNTNYSFTTDQIATAFSSNRFLDIPFASSLSPGAYWAVFGMSSSSSSAGAAGIGNNITNCNVRYSAHYGISQADLSFGIMGSTNRTSGGLLGAGSFSTAGGGTTNSIPISAISSIASLARMYFQVLRSA